jgi:hypothetical protein
VQSLIAQRVSARKSVARGIGVAEKNKNSTILARLCFMVERAQKTLKRFMYKGLQNLSELSVPSVVKYIKNEPGLPLSAYRQGPTLCGGG